jgi:hypothetical protein
MRPDEVIIRFLSEKPTIPSFLLSSRVFFTADTPVDILHATQQSDIRSESDSLRRDTVINGRILTNGIKIQPVRANNNQCISHVSP